jgi:O-antigen/teichoic acid export membrane protein
MPEFKSDSSSRRIMKNGVFTALRFGVNSLSGFVLVYFFTRKFGTETFGLIALAGFLTTYIGMISQCTGTAVGRFMNVALNKNDWQQANEIYSTAIIANLAFICIQLPVFAGAIWKLNWFFDFAPEITRDFQILVACNVAVFFMNMIGGVIFTPIQAANRVDIGMKFEIWRQILRLILLFGLISLLGAKLWIIGVIDLGLSLFLFGWVVAICRKMVDSNLKFRLRFITWKWVLPVANMTGWVLVFVLGQAFFVKTDVWVLNKFVSPEMAGIYAALLVWPNAIRQVGNQVEALIAPVYMIDYAKGNVARIGEGCIFLSKIMSLFAATVGGVMCGASSVLLPLWLGKEFVQFDLLFLIMMIYVVLTMNKAVTWPVFTAFNKVNQLGITTLFCGILNLFLSIVLASLGYGALGVASATLFSLFLLFGVLYPWRVSTILDISLLPFLKGHVSTLGLFFFIYFGTSFGLGMDAGWMPKAGAMVSVLALAVALMWGVLLSSHEKKHVLGLIRKACELINIRLPI